jgi:hypothetical protein
MKQKSNALAKAHGPSHLCKRLRRNGNSKMQHIGKRQVESVEGDFNSSSNNEPAKTKIDI